MCMCTPRPPQRARDPTCAVCGLPGSERRDVTCTVTSGSVVQTCETTTNASHGFAQRPANSRRAKFGCCRLIRFCNTPATTIYTVTQYAQHNAPIWNALRHRLPTLPTDFAPTMPIAKYPKCSSASRRPVWGRLQSLTSRRGRLRGAAAGEGASPDPGSAGGSESVKVSSADDPAAVCPSSGSSRTHARRAPEPVVGGTCIGRLSGGHLVASNLSPPPYQAPLSTPAEAAPTMVGGVVSGVAGSVGSSSALAPGKVAPAGKAPVGAEGRAAGGGALPQAN